MLQWSSRAAESADLGLAYEISKAAMQEYVEQTWGAWNERDQLAKHAQDFNPASHRIILVAGIDAGLLAVEDEPTHLWLVKLYILPQFRNQGLGTQVLRGVIEQAAALSKAVRLRVLRVNVKAQALYARNGFHIVAETPERIFMETQKIAA